MEAFAVEVLAVAGSFFHGSRGCAAAASSGYLYSPVGAVAAGAVGVVDDWVLHFSGWAHLSRPPLMCYLRADDQKSAQN